MGYYAGLKCQYCGTETDGNGDCAYYCEDDYCGYCNETIERRFQDHHTHIKEKKS